VSARRICFATFRISSIASKLGRRQISEAVSRLPNDVTELAPEIPWLKIKAMRNLIAHDYAGIDPNIVWKTVRERVPELRKAVASLLERYAQG
jgi:uncharacterized protein with HEPN domain